MALFKKKRDSRELKLPELPMSPAFPELPREEEESSMSSLPALPQLKPLPQLPSLPQISQQKMQPLMTPMSKFEMPSQKPMEMEFEERKTGPSGQVFVKIDKFKDAMSNFEIVKKRLQESSMLLDKIKETRAKEEEELTQWANELNAIKEKLLQIDKKIFSNID